MFAFAFLIISIRLIYFNEMNAFQMMKNDERMERTMRVEIIACNSILNGHRFIWRNLHPISFAPLQHTTTTTKTPQHFIDFDVFCCKCAAAAAVVEQWFDVVFHGGGTSQINLLYSLGIQSSLHHHPSVEWMPHMPHMPQYAHTNAGFFRIILSKKAFTTRIFICQIWR